MTVYTVSNTKTTVALLHMSRITVLEAKLSDLKLARSGTLKPDCTNNASYEHRPLRHFICLKANFSSCLTNVSRHMAFDHIFDNRTAADQMLAFPFCLFPFHILVCVSHSQF